MMIITIARQFGSGGREIGKRLADYLGFDYYDREIIETIAKEKGLSADYVESALERGPISIPLTFCHSFTSTAFMQQEPAELLRAEHEVLTAIAAKGRDCIIVGRNADIILADYQPLRLFVHADMDARVQRCRERQKEGENLSDKDLRRNIQRIDHNRKESRELLADGEWGHAEAYDLCINTSGKDIKKMAQSLSVFIKAEYE